MKIASEIDYNNGIELIERMFSGSIKIVQLALLRLNKLNLTPFNLVLLTVNKEKLYSILGMYPVFDIKPTEDGYIVLVPVDAM